MDVVSAYKRKGLFLLLSIPLLMIGPANAQGAGPDTTITESEAAKAATYSSNKEHPKSKRDAAYRVLCHYMLGIKADSEDRAILLQLNLSDQTEPGGPEVRGAEASDTTTPKNGTTAGPTDYTNLENALYALGFTLKAGVYWFTGEETGTGGYCVEYNFIQKKTNATGGAATTPVTFSPNPVTELSLFAGTTFKAIGDKAGDSTQTPWMAGVSVGFGAYSADSSNKRSAALFNIELADAHFHGPHFKRDQPTVGLSMDYITIYKLYQTFSGNGSSGSN